jgi:hypothetical protein
MLVFFEEMLVLSKKTVVFLEKTCVLPRKWLCSSRCSFGRCLYFLEMLCFSKDWLCF